MAANTARSANIAVPPVVICWVRDVVSGWPEVRAHVLRGLFSDLDEIIRSSCFSVRHVKYV